MPYPGPGVRVRSSRATHDWEAELSHTTVYRLKGKRENGPGLEYTGFKGNVKMGPTGLK